MNTRFYRCRHCGNVIQKYVDSKVEVVCCGEKMQELVPNTVEASVEKHLPVITRLNESYIKIEVGSTEHPMLPEHHIDFIYLEFHDGGLFIKLKGQNKAETVVGLCHGMPVAVYEYCNIHGLWKSSAE